MTMHKISSFLILVAVFSSTMQSYSQRNTSIPFLLIAPSAEANGMGEASVAISTNDPLALMTNPAHLGAQSRTMFAAYGHNYADWLPPFHLSDLWLRTDAVTAGINLRKINENAPPLSIGVGYSRVKINLGEFVQTSPTGPDVISRSTASETSDQYSIGMNLDYWVRASVGFTYKHIVSRMPSVGTETAGPSGDGTINLYDYGVLLDVPVVDIVSKLTEWELGVTRNLSPFYDLSIGISKSNLGHESMTYSGVAQGDPLPRYARAGLGMELGMSYVKDDLVWKPFAIKWTIESGSILVGSDRKYMTGLGGINFWNQVIMGRAKKETIMSKGWEFGAMELLAIRGGRFEEDPGHGNRRLDTWGWGFQFAGMPKLLRALDVPLPTEGVFGFLLNHVNVSYNHCEWNPDDYLSPLVGTKYDGVNVSIMN